MLRQSLLRQPSEMNPTQERPRELSTLGTAEDLDSLDAQRDVYERSHRMTLLKSVSAHIAHELGTPLNVITGRASMIASSPEAGAEAIADAKIIIAQAQKLTSSIRQILHQIRRPVERKRVDVVTLVARALALATWRARNHGVELLSSHDEGPIFTEGDPLELIQVPSCLIENAIVAAPRGGQVKIAVRREARRTARHTSNDKDEASESRWVTLSVEDEGEGIAPEALPQIFKPFYTTRGPHEGVGLGLSIAQAIVRDHGGHIDVDSEKGKGTCFKVFLPEGSSNDAGTRPDRG